MDEPYQSPELPRPRKRREGAVMLAVLLLIMMSTLTGMVAMHSSTFELRTVGTERRALQTHDLAEGALGATLAMVDAMGPVALRIGLSRSTTNVIDRLAPEEPQFTSGRSNYRVALTDFPALAGVEAPVIETSATTGESLGPTLGVEPDFVVDINDDYIVTTPITGHRSDGYGVLRFMMATYTSRGRTRPVGTAVGGPAGDGNAVGFGSGAGSIHETAANSRAYALSGPFPWED
jgi:hypothetical protein